MARTELAVFDLDWLDGHPNRRGGSVITRTDATVMQYCSYMGEIPTEDGARRNRPAVWINVFEYSSRVCEVLERYRCNELGGNMARFTQFPIMITRSTIIYEIISPGAAGRSIYV